MFSHVLSLHIFPAPPHQPCDDFGLYKASVFVSSWEVVFSALIVLFIFYNPEVSLHGSSGVVLEAFVF